MKTVKVTYTVKPAFAETNKKNVKEFIGDLEMIDHPDLRYMALLSNDGKTFNHIAFYEDGEAQKVLFDLPSFQYFQKQRDASGLEKEPQIDELNLIASSFQIFKK